MAIWNPWHGCIKLSPGCKNCYVYRRDESIGKDASIVTRTGDFTLPLKKDRKGQYKLSSLDGTVYTCMTSDYFLDEADAWRQECWDMIRERNDLEFCIITKRIDRFLDICLYVSLRAWAQRLSRGALSEAREILGACSRPCPGSHRCCIS